jgi:hypothetical protein
MLEKGAPFAGFPTSQFPLLAMNERPIYITRSGFFGPFALDSEGLFGEIAALNRTLPR